MARPPFTPTQEQRKMVKSMAAYGMRQEEIAAVLGVRSKKTLRKHFRNELDRGVIEANIQVAQALYKWAISGQSPPSTMFWLKTRAGWRERGAAPSAGASAPPFVVGVVKKP